MKKLVDVLHMARHHLGQEQAKMTVRRDYLPFQVAWLSTTLLTCPRFDIRAFHAPVLYSQGEWNRRDRRDFQHPDTARDGSKIRSNLSSRSPNVTP